MDDEQKRQHRADLRCRAITFLISQLPKGDLVHSSLLPDLRAVMHRSNARILEVLNSLALLLVQESEITAIIPKLLPQAEVTLFAATHNMMLPTPSVEVVSIPGAEDAGDDILEKSSITINSLCFMARNLRRLHIDNSPKGKDFLQEPVFHQPSSTIDPSILKFDSRLEVTQYICSHW